MGSSPSGRFPVWQALYSVLGVQDKQEAVPVGIGRNGGGGVEGSAVTWEMGGLEF